MAAGAEGVASDGQRQWPPTVLAAGGSQSPVRRPGGRRVETCTVTIADSQFSSYHQPCRLAQSSSAADMATMTNNTATRCAMSLSVLTMMFIP
jgi:hypothetical protein